MTRKERILAAVRLREVDRVPHATYNIYPYRGNGHGGDASYAEILDQIRKTAGAMIKVAVGSEGPGLSRALDGAVERRVEGDDDDRTVTAVLHTPAGELTAVHRSPRNKPGRTTKAYISSDADMERFMSIPYVPPRYDAAEARRISGELGEHGVVFVTFAEPMYSIAANFDFEDFCVRCITGLGSIKRMLDWAAERCIENMRLLVDACRGLECIFHTGGPEICTPPMMAPHLFSELVTPYLKKLIEVAHDAGFPTAIHCHGHVREVFPEILETGADLLEPIEPLPQGNITLEELLPLAAGRICLMGYVQDQDLYTAPEGQLRAWVEHVSRIAGGRSGYIMSPTCTPFQFPCSPEYRRNYLEWLRAADELL